VQVEKTEKIEKKKRVGKKKTVEMMKKQRDEHWEEVRL
jgi:hypothetical protein